MPTVFTGWSNTNELRNYPLHDYASKQSATGAVMPDGLIADANIMVPESAGRFVFVSSLVVTPGLVSVTFLATDEDPFSSAGQSSSSGAGFVPLASIVVTRPLDAFKNYPITPLYPGVAGWVAFGSDVEENDNLAFRFTEASQSVLDAKAARSYRDYPVSSLKKAGRLTELTGLVQLFAGDDIVINKSVRTINGRKRNVITIGLDLTTEAAEKLREYAGACGTRPEDETCEQGKAFLTINGVPPDCDGNVDIIFEGLDAQLTGVDAGLVVDVPIGLDDVCTEFDPERYDPNDLCEEQPSSSESSDSSSSEIPPSSSSATPEPVYDSYFDDFTDPERTFEWMIPQQGIWSIKEVEPSEATSGISRLYCTESDAPSVIVVPRVPKVDTIGYRTFSVIRPFSAAANGHVIFGYKGLDDFWYAGVSVNTERATNGLLYFGHKTGDLGSSLDAWPYGLEFGYQFDLSGAPDMDAGAGIISSDGVIDVDVRVDVRVEPVEAASELKLVTVEWYWNRSGQGFPNPTDPFNTAKLVTGFDLSGICGVGAVGCEAHYDNFGVFGI